MFDLRSHVLCMFIHLFARSCVRRCVLSITTSAFSPVAFYMLFSTDDGSKILL